MYQYAYAYDEKEARPTRLYTYDGPVMEFEKIITNHWHGSTYAVSEKKARCNLAYQYKKQFNKIPATKISLPGKLIVAE